MWEYKVIEIMGPAEVTHGRPIKGIDEYGRDGWELVTVTTQNEMHMAYFKRKIDGDVALEQSGQPIQ